MVLDLTGASSQPSSFFDLGLLHCGSCRGLEDAREICCIVAIEPRRGLSVCSRVLLASCGRGSFFVSMVF